MSIRDLLEFADPDDKEAALIAAAPDMLAALKEIAKVASSTRRLEENMAWIEHAATMATAKAEGKQEESIWDKPINYRRATGGKPYKVEP